MIFLFFGSVLLCCMQNIYFFAVHYSLRLLTGVGDFHAGCFCLMPFLFIYCRSKNLDTFLQFNWDLTARECKQCDSLFVIVATHQALQQQMISMEYGEITMVPWCGCIGQQVLLLYFFPYLWMHLGAIIDSSEWNYMMHWCMVYNNRLCIISVWSFWFSFFVLLVSYI